MSTVDPTDEFLGFETDEWTEPLAQAILLFGTSEARKTRSAELSAKADNGTISDAERLEHERYMNTADILAIMKSRARRFLATHQS